MSYKVIHATSYKMRRSRGGWVVWTKIMQLKMQPSKDGNSLFKSVTVNRDIQKCSTRGEARELANMLNDLVDRVRKSVYDKLVNFKSWEVPVVNNNGATTDTLSDGLSESGIVPEVQSKNL